MFSIIIPVYNKEAYLIKTINSVLNQTFENFEIILINDGSTDNSRIICEKFVLDDKRIKLVNTENLGVSSARNTGIRIAQFQLIAFLDADDFWDEIYLEEMNTLASKYPMNLIYSTKYSRIINNKIIEDENHFIDNFQESLVFNLIDDFCKKGRFPLHTSSVIIRKPTNRNFEYFDERIHVFEDYDYFLRIALISNVAYLNKRPLSFYNTDVPVKSKSRGKVPDIKKNWIFYMSKYENLLAEQKNLKLLLDRMRLNQLIYYSQHRIFHKEVSAIKSIIDKKNYGWKNTLIFITPFFFRGITIKIYSFLINFRSNFAN